MSEDDLNFQTEASRAFAFLITDFGFQLVRAEPTFLRYEAPNGMFVNVYHGRSSFELKFELGHQLPSGVEEMFYPCDIAPAPHQSFFQASTADGVRTSLPQLAHLLHERGADALRGDPFALKRLRDQQIRASDALLRDWALEAARRGVSEAWRERNFRRVVELFEPLQEHLTPAERKKLEYARQH